MDPIVRRRLERIAWNHANASRNHDEAWSFLFQTEGAVSYNYFPLSGLDCWEFDGDLDGLELAWPAERIEEIVEGADPDEKELDQWRWAKCRSLADGTDWTWIVWIVPLRVEGEIAGYAAFVSSSDDGDPTIKDVFQTREDAERTLSEEGVLLAG
jgi:hypothetical protein